MAAASNVGEIGGRPASAFDKESQRLLKRREIIRVAGRLFCKKGFRATSLGDIAGEMNITKTVIYYYFRNKAEIFSHCHSQAVDAMEASMAQASKSGNPVDHIRDFIRIYIQELIGINNPGAVLLDDDLLPPEEGDNIRERKQAMLKKLEALIASGIEKGDIRPCNPKAATMALMSAINILPRWYNENGPLSPEILAESYSNIFISGLAAR